MAMEEPTDKEVWFRCWLGERRGQRHGFRTCVLLLEDAGEQGSAQEVLGRSNLIGRKRVLRGRLAHTTVPVEVKK